MTSILLVAISYLIGNLSPAYLLGKVVWGIDIRQHGSGNAGTTNMMRLFGVRAAVLVLMLDLFKGVAAVWIGRYFGHETTAVLCGLAAVMGHSWPVLYHFQGGKGVATSIGAGLMIQPVAGLLCIGLAVVIILVTRYVSLASLVGIPAWTILLWLLDSPLEHVLFGVAISLLVLVRHRTNIQRIARGEENKIALKKK